MPRIARVLVLAVLFGTPLAGDAQRPVLVSRFRVQVAAEDVAPPGPSFLQNVLRRLQLRTLGVVDPKPGNTYRVTAVAYSSTVDQTDLSPCITAAGTRVRRGIVATNFLPLGTRLRIGDGVFVVEDRMAARYNGVPIIDIWHSTREEALQFGRQDLVVEILPPGAAVAAAPEPAGVPGENTEEPRRLLEEIMDTVRTISDRARALLPARAIPQERDCLTLPDAPRASP